MPPGKDDDVHWMRAAVRGARKGIGLTAPNPPVGAVIVKGGKLLGSGWHRRAGEPHAEIEAIGDAGRKHGSSRLSGATLYVTLEPCSTQGRTPPCTSAILDAGFTRVVFGSKDPNPAHAGRAVRMLRRQGMLVDTGMLEAECRELIRPFGKLMTTGLPWLISKCALSLDGRITRPPGESSWITGEAAREDVHKLRSEVDAILIGGNTARQDDPSLTVRGPASRRRSGHPQPWRVVMTRQASLPGELQLCQDEHRDRTLVYRNQSLKQVLRKLGKKGCLSVLLESGGNLTGQAFAAGLVDELVWYLAPTVLGSGFTAADLGPKLPPGWNGVDIRNLSIKKVGRDFRLRGRTSNREE